MATKKWVNSLVGVRGEIEEGTEVSLAWGRSADELGIRGGNRILKNRAKRGVGKSGHHLKQA